MLDKYYQTTYAAIRAILPEVWIIIMVRDTRHSCRCATHDHTDQLSGTLA